MKINPFLTYETVTARVTPKNLCILRRGRDHHL